MFSGSIGWSCCCERKRYGTPFLRQTQIQLGLRKITTILIGLSLEDAEIFRISRCRTAKDAWNTLTKSYHEKSTLSIKVKLIRAICFL